MANMSYCRFRNTLTDLRDCNEHILSTDLSQEENEARIALVKVAADIFDQLGIDVDLGDKSVEDVVANALQEWGGV